MSNYLKILDDTLSMRSIRKAVNDGAMPNHWKRFCEFFTEHYPGEQLPAIEDYQVYAQHWPYEYTIKQVVEFAKIGSRLNLSESEFVGAFMIHVTGNANPVIVRDTFRELKAN